MQCIVTGRLVRNMWRKVVSDLKSTVMLLYCSHHTYISMYLPIYLKEVAPKVSSKRRMGAKLCIGSKTKTIELVLENPINKIDDCEMKTP